MTKEVKILEVGDSRITAGCDRNACEGCKSSTFCRGKNSEFEVLNPHGLRLEKGDEVQIAMPAGRTVFASAMSLIFPLLCFFTGMLLAYSSFPQNEILQLLSAIAGLAAGFGISALYFHFTKGRYTPTVEKKLGEE